MRELEGGHGKDFRQKKNLKFYSVKTPTGTTSRRRGGLRYNPYPQSTPKGECTMSWSDRPPSSSCMWKPDTQAHHRAVRRVALPELICRVMIRARSSSLQYSEEPHNHHKFLIGTGVTTTTITSVTRGSSIPPAVSSISLALLPPFNSVEHTFSSLLCSFNFTTRPLYPSPSHPP